MTTTPTLTVTEFLTARLDEQEAKAREAIDPERPGTHWQWVSSETDELVSADVLAEALEHQELSLRTVEEFDTAYVGKLPAFAIRTVDSGIPGALAHIVANDPAAVLADIATKRRVVEEWEQWSPSLGGPRGRGYLDGLKYAVRILASAFASHPDWREEWRP